MKILQTLLKHSGEVLVLDTIENERSEREFEL